MNEIIKWEQLTFVTGSYTSFGIYDDDPQFQKDAVKVAKYVLRTLGYPIVQIQLAPQHIFTAFETAIMKYTSIVNEYKITDHLLNVYGGDPTNDLTRAAIYENLSSTFRISSVYAQQGYIYNTLHLPVYTTSIDIIAGQQQYDLTKYIPQYTSSYEVQFLQIYYKPNLYNFLTPYDSLVFPGFGSNIGNAMLDFGGVYANNAKLLILPLFQGILNIQQLQMIRQMRTSNVSFWIRGNTILFTPTPQHNSKVYIDYILRSDKEKNCINQNQNVINNISNFPINDYIKYSEINIPGRNWIQRYTLALSKQILGTIRSKYSNIPYPEGEVSLDGEILRQEAVTEQDKLVEELKSILQQSTMTRLIQKKKDMAQNIQDINSKIPIGRGIIIA